MKDVKQIEFVGTHDYDNDSAMRFASWDADSFSIGIFKWEMKSRAKEMKRSKVVVRVIGWPKKKERVFQLADEILKLLDAGQYTGPKVIDFTSARAEEILSNPA